MVKILPSSTRGVGSNPGQRTKIPHALGPQNSKHETEAILKTNSIRTLKNGSHPKNLLKKTESIPHFFFCPIFSSLSFHCIGPESPPNKIPHANLQVSVCFWKSIWGISCIQIDATCYMLNCHQLCFFGNMFNTFSCS